ncbi:MAG: S8 family serine peptidase [Actinomycetota bacterium]
MRPSGGRRPAVGILALAVAGLLVATVAAAPATTDDVGGEAAAGATVAQAGVLQPAMVEMLHHEGAERAPVTLAALSYDIVERRGRKHGDGAGIDVALIDTGVAPVDGLQGTDKVIHGPDLSMETGSPVAHLDTYGHGTHLAGIIAGTRSGHEGIAPGARIVSVKVAGHDGLTTVPQVVAAVDWVIENRNRDGLNIRVLNLSLGQAEVDSHVGDHLSAAVERAWDAGIFVVVAAGNRGAEPGHLDSPAIDPYVLSVAAVDSTYYTEWEELQPATQWSSRGNDGRLPDLAAPGQSILSYRVPGSTIDERAPRARDGDLFRGSGTSQSAAAISGLAARLLEYRPDMTPDQLKATMRRSTMTMVERVGGPEVGQGVINATRAYRKPLYTAPTQDHVRATSGHGGISLPAGNTWSGGTWSGGTWSGGTWSGATWSGATWSGATWSGGTWSGATWSGATWSGATWSNGSWS